eukprot:7228711-Prymnesium_polylepis.1
MHEHARYTRHATVRRLSDCPFSGGAVAQLYSIRELLRRLGPGGEDTLDTAAFYSSYGSGGASRPKRKWWHAPRGAKGRVDYPDT